MIVPGGNRGYDSDSSILLQILEYSLVTHLFQPFWFNHFESLLLASWHQLSTEVVDTPRYPQLLLLLRSTSFSRSTL